MKNAFALISLVLVVVTVGCAAQVSTSKSAADWRSAYVSGPEVAVSYCDQNKSSREAYYACLEELDRQRREGLLQVGNSARPNPTVRPQASAQPPAPLPPPTSTASAQPPSLLPPPVAAQPGNMYIPGAMGAVCETNESLQLVVDNDSEYMVEVRASGKIAPLGCDAQDKLVLMTVTRRNGQTDRVWLIPPHMQHVKFVFLPLNGGLGMPRVTFNAYLNLACQSGVCPALPGIGYLERTFNVPRSNAQANYQQVAPSYLTIFGQH